MSSVIHDTLWTHVAGDADPWKMSTDAKATVDLVALDRTRAVWANILTPGLFVVAGQVPSATAIPLVPGWNLVGFPSFSTTYTAADLMAETGALAVEGFDGSADPYRLRSLAPTEPLVAGRGYWVLVPAATTWMVTN